MHIYVHTAVKYIQYTNYIHSFTYRDNSYLEYIYIFFVCLFFFKGESTLETNKTNLDIFFNLFLNRILKYLTRNKLPYGISIYLH